MHQNAWLAFIDLQRLALYIAVQQRVPLEFEYNARYLARHGSLWYKYPQAEFETG